MVGTRWQPFTELRAEMNRLRDEMDRLFARRGAGSWSLFPTVTYPAMNVWEDEQRLYVEAELPGLDLGDLEIYVNAGNQLTVKGERKSPAVEHGTWHRRERGCGTFSRTVELPSSVDANKVEAEFKNGVLLVTLPKAEEARPRRIAVKAE